MNGVERRREAGAAVPQGPWRTGFTLIEVMMVLLVLAIGVSIVAPAFVTPRDKPESALASLIGRAQDIAASRQEITYLGISARGAWRLDVGATAAGHPLASGDLDGYRGPRATLVVSPLGSCGFDVRSTDAANAMPVDPLTCRLLTP